MNTRYLAEAVAGEHGVARWGQKATAQNRLTHGADSLAFRAAMAYCDAVGAALGGKWSSEA